MNSFEEHNSENEEWKLNFRDLIIINVIFIILHVIQATIKCTIHTVEVLLNNTNLTFLVFLYKIIFEGFSAKK